MFSSFCNCCKVAQFAVFSHKMTPPAKTNAAANALRCDGIANVARIWRQIVSKLIAKIDSFNIQMHKLSMYDIRYSSIQHSHSTHI